MRKRIGIILLLVLLCNSSWAQSNIVSSLSPKLKKFLSENPNATKIFTNAISSAFSNKTVCLYYFYSDESDTPAFHFYPNTVGLPEVILCVQENQSPLDEFITTLFETLNSKREEEFATLCQRAASGTIAREQFAKEILRNEFEAIKDVRAVILTLTLKKNEIKKSGYYQKFADCPTNFDGFLSYSKNFKQRDALKEYELKYDSLRKMYSDQYSTNSVAPKN